MEVPDQVGEDKLKPSCSPFFVMPASERASPFLLEQELL